MPEAKTVPTAASVPDFLSSVENPGRREDAFVLDEIFRRVSGFEPVMWGPTIVGYGRYDYTYDTGWSGSALATGFSPRKANMVLYIMPGYANFGPILDRLGKHKMGKSCLYLGRLKNVDLDVLAELIQAGLLDLGGIYPIHPK